jgi:hypothetical protein
MLRRQVVGLKAESYKVIKNLTLEESTPDGGTVTCIFHSVSAVLISTAMVFSNCSTVWRALGWQWELQY